MAVNPYGLPLWGNPVDVYGYGTQSGLLAASDYNAGNYLGSWTLPNLGYGQDAFFDVTSLFSGMNAPYVAFNLRSGGVDVFSSLHYNYDHPSELILTTVVPELQAQVSFTFSSSPSAGSQPDWVTAADVNGDGKLDLICANAYTTTLTVLTNDGNGGFVLASSPRVGNNPNGVVAADVNGDGKVVLISANYYDNTLTVLTNNGSGGFVTAGTYSVGSFPRQVIAADVNGDGKLDLISTSENDNTLTVLTNDGRGGFVLSATLSVGSGADSVVAADVNGNGWVDLISANYNDGSLTVLTNNGSGGFVTAGTYSVGGNPRQVVAADVNGDGKVDLISANSGDNTLTVLTNATAFPPASPPTITSQPASQIVPYGATITFSVVATGFPALSYQWSLNGTNISGATSSYLQIYSVSMGNLGNYVVQVSNGYGSAVSSPATLSMLPSIISPFTGVTGIWGESAVLNVGAAGSGTLNFQWFMNGVAIPGANSATYSIPALQFTNDALYSVVVSSDFGSVTNAPAQLIVNSAVISLGLYAGVTIQGVAGYTYMIQYSTNLNDPNSWENVARAFFIYIDAYWAWWKKPWQCWAEKELRAGAKAE